MRQEKKKVVEEWNDRILQREDIYAAEIKISEADSRIRQAAGILEEAGFGYDYTVTQEEISRNTGDEYALLEYIKAVARTFYEKIDRPFYEKFVNGATEQISRVRLGDFETENTIGAQQTRPIRGYACREKKPKLTFGDFLGINQPLFLGDPEMNELERFAGSFRENYESLLAEGKLDPEETGSPEEYLAQFAGMGEFGHSMDKPFLSFLAGMLQVTIIVPLIEAATGEEVFTGEDLSDYERGMRVVFAVVDAVSLGNSLAATGIARMGCREALEMTGKVVAVEFVSDTAAYMAGEAGTGLGLPVPVVLLLSLGTGITVSCRGTDLLFKNTGGDILATAHNAAKNATDGTLDILNGNAYDDILTAGRRADAAGTPGRRAGRVTDGVDGRDVQHSDIHVQQTECTEGYGDYLLRECGSEGGTDTIAYHSVGGENSAKKIQSVLDGIDISYTSPESRFGQGFYVAAEGNTTVAELAYHGTDSKYSIRYDMNLEGQKVLDLTDPKVASEWGFLQGESSLLECQNIAEKALNEGYNVIKVQSYRDMGINYVIYDNFDEILRPQMVTPIGD